MEAGYNCETVAGSSFCSLIPESASSTSDQTADPIDTIEKQL